MTDEEMQELNRQLRAMVEQENNTPLDDLAGLSPAQVDPLMRDVLGKGSVVQWAGSAEFDFNQVPILKLMDYLTDRLLKGEIKLTAKGNLNRALLRELYQLEAEGSSIAPEHVNNLRSMEDWPIVVCLMVILKEAGVTKIRRQRLSLTAKGKKILKEPFELFRLLFTAAFDRFNLAYGDWSKEGTESVQAAIGFALYLFLKDGKVWRPYAHYPAATLRAFPMLLEPVGSVPAYNVAYNIVFTERLFSWFGLVRKKGEWKPKIDDREVMATDLFRALFKLDADARPEPIDNPDAQIRTALFDAEMGGVSWTSGEMSDEAQQAFHDSIRAFHAKDGPGGVTIGSLMEDLDLIEPDELTGEEQAIELVNQLIRDMSERHVFFPPPVQLPPSVLYRFMVTNLFDHVIPPPSEQMPALVPFESVDSDVGDFTELTFIAEQFILNMLQLERPLEAERFYPTVRLGNDVVPREVAMAHAEKWRSGFSSIQPLSFAPGPAEEGQFGVKFQFLNIAYRVTYPDGREEEFDGPGVIQLAPAEEGWLVQGGMFEGFLF